MHRGGPAEGAVQDQHPPNFVNMDVPEVAFCRLFKFPTWVRLIIFVGACAACFSPHSGVGAKTSLQVPCGIP